MKGLSKKASWSAFSLNAICTAQSFHFTSRMRFNTQVHSDFSLALESWTKASTLK